MIVSMSVYVGILWCGNFNRGLLNRLWVRNLRYAYRAPSLFVSKMIASGAAEIAHYFFDETLSLSNLDGSTRSIQDEVDILYVSTHGQFTPNGYEALLETVNWSPSATGIGATRLKVAVFDTCHLIDGSQNWQQHWQTNLGPELRVLLGFDGLAAIDRGSATRGGAFAENLVKGQAFADAWLGAVKNTRISQHSKAVAIGIGDDPTDAQFVLNTATLYNLPPARMTQQPSFHSQR